MRPMSQPKRQISNTAPSYSIFKVFSTISEKGFLGALEDPEQGPHVHLTFLLITIFVVSAGIILVTKLFI
ncbi:MAG: hypothetical protein ACMUIE_04575 [Thermoplasmatota archaeon]